VVTGKKGIGDHGLSLLAVKMTRDRGNPNENLRGSEVNVPLTLTANPDRCAVSPRGQTQCSPAQADR
jgi:hypothetical protein